MEKPTLVREDAPDLDDLTAMFADLARNRAWLTA